MSFSIIAAVGKNLELGFRGGLIFHIPEDMKFFRETTTGHPVVMGRKTFFSIGRALPGRTNIVVTRGSSDLPEGIEVVNDVEKFIEEFRDSDEEIFVIGGGEIYRKFLPFANKLYLTEVEAEAEADTFFPEFSRENYTQEILGAGEYDGLKYRFAKYTRQEGK